MNTSHFCQSISAVNSGSESWTGIGVVVGCAAVWLITQGPHVKDMAVYERITFLHILQEVRGIGKTCNQLTGYRSLAARNMDGHGSVDRRVMRPCVVHAELSPIDSDPIDGMRQGVAARYVSTTV